jgi:hypothetical protein
MHIMVNEYPASLCSMRENDFLCILWSRNILQVFVQWENTIFYVYYDHGISCKSLFNERLWFFTNIMIKEYSASLCSMREYDFLCMLWSWNMLQVFVQWENIIFYLYYDQGIFYKSLSNKRIWFFMHIMIKKYPASLCSMRENDFLCILWSRNILQVFVQWENTIFYVYYDHGISCKSLSNERLWFFTNIMIKEYSTSLCSMREYDFLCILWLRNILQVIVQWENMIFYAYYDHGIFCKSLFHERIWFFMHIMTKEYAASLCSMREYDFLCVWWCSNILQAFVSWENMILYAYYDWGIFCKSLFHERIWFLCILWLRNILQVFVQWENMIFYAYYD